MEACLQGTNASSSACEEPQFLFMPRELPDNLSSMSTKSEKAMLLGARLYSQTEDGVQRPAVKLGERGYHVEGHLISAGSDFSQLVERTDALEKFPSVSEKDVVKVVARDGKRVKAYVYHMEEVDNEQPVQGGRWREL